MDKCAKKAEQDKKREPVSMHSLLPTFILKKKKKEILPHLLCKALFFLSFFFCDANLQRNIAMYVYNFICLVRLKKKEFLKKKYVYSIARMVYSTYSPKAGQREGDSVATLFF